MTQIQTFPTRREMYAAVIPRGTRGAELGVAQGHNAHVLYQVTRPEAFYLVDPWMGESGAANLAQVVAHWAVANVAIVQQDDLQWLADLPPDGLDWVYLDTLHDYEHTARELAAMCGKVTQIIAGHDWCCTADHHDSVWTRQWQGGVMRAVIEQIQTGWLELVAITLPVNGGVDDDIYPSWACRVKEITR